MREVQGVAEVLQREVDRTYAHHSVMSREGQNLQHRLHETEERARVQVHNFQTECGKSRSEMNTVVV
eukprot:1905399-Amphidinium_carterae.2